MYEMVPPGPCYQVHGTLGELLAPGGENAAWFDFLPDAWWWCSLCFAVCQEKEIGVYGLTETTYEGLTCPHCGNDGSSLDTAPGLYWYHGWPSRVLVGWVASPVSGQRFPLPHDEQSRPVPQVKPGKNSHRPHLSRRRRK